MPEYITKEAGAHIQRLRRRQEEFAEVTARFAQELNDKHDEAMKATFAADALAYNLQTMIGIAAFMSWSTTRFIWL